MKIDSITFITGNAAKAEQLGRHFNYPVSHKKLDLPEIQSLELKEVVEQKAKDAYAIVGSTVLVEDTSLIFKALGKLPGPLIKWFYEELGNEGICEIFGAQKNKSFVAEVCLGLYNGKELKTFTGKINGTIAKKPRGEKGFGWDPIFIPKGSRKTWGEMTPEEQKKTSMRRTALKKLEKYLKENN